jgi:hypothetical protein
MSLLDSLQDAYSQTVEIEPISASASPSTKATYQTLLNQANQYTGQILAHLQGVAAASLLGVAEEEVEEVNLNDGSGEWGEYMRI